MVMLSQHIRHSMFTVSVVAILLTCSLSGCSWNSKEETHGKTYYTNDQVYEYAPGWYRGVLHCHALFDSLWLTPIAAVVDLAEDQGFDFFVMTNHNTIFEWESPGYQSRQLTILYGVEWTSSTGHANIWSDQPFDWDSIAQTASTGDVKKAIHMAHDLSTANHPVLFSINHPDRQSSSSWQASYDVSKNADAIEVWNKDSIFLSPTDTPLSYLDQGRKMTMVGGSDVHLKEMDDMEAFSAYLERPTTWVYAESMSGKDILSGIKRGHVFVTASVEGPQLNFTAQTSIGALIMGDTIPASDLGTPISFTVAVTDAVTPFGVIVVKNGEPQEPLSQTSSAPMISFSFMDVPQEGTYYRIEVHQITTLPIPFDELILEPIVALSNPIYTW